MARSLPMTRFLLECPSSMSEEQHSKEPGEAAIRRRRVDPPKGWKAIPLGVKVLALICLLVLILIPVAKQRGGLRQEKPVENTVTDTGYVPGLVVSEATVDRKSRTVKGIVTNGTDKTMDDVTVTYYVRDDAGAEAGEISAKIGRLAPHQNAHFESTPMDPRGADPVLRYVTGIPR